ncbi:Carboxypeptidase C (cathepsin A) [Phyllobacterium sp. YR620]|uniref:S10 family serine carboxypeptidase-like protein n=1 Tax=Phyllobacterium sp. YR620 TaxID=1881066 RepID=UPI00087F88F0|nr:hypothetical protein [Phyllobacterium sp. YR620]SDO79758.1 Carboxypeptidase C (cathepsin A) [Phyllobacterium sp. YR620]
MKFQFYALAPLLLLTACDGSTSPSSQNGAGVALAEVQPTLPAEPAPGGEGSAQAAPASAVKEVKGQENEMPKAEMDAASAKKAADDYLKKGNLTKAVNTLKGAGLPSEAGEMLANAGHEDEAFEILAPKDKVVDDKRVYDGSDAGSLALDKVDEVVSVKRSSMKIGGKTVQFTASAGHLTAYDLKTNKPQATIFFMAYTRDGLPKGKRPVTFLFNGGPGGASLSLQMGSWGPKRLKAGYPDIPEQYQTSEPDRLPFISNAETLLDKTDLVFVDPVGTGYSQAIAPKKNADFWGLDEDPPVLRDFIRRYVNLNTRQLSPKYLYGISYSGVRTPILANLMEDAGKSQFEPDKSGKDPIVLSGVILNSPALDYDSLCSAHGDDWKKPISCAGYVPTYAMIADWYKESKARASGTSVESYLDTIRTFMKTKFAAADKIYYAGTPNENTMNFASKEWTSYLASKEGKDLTQYLEKITTAKQIYWKDGVNMFPGYFLKQLFRTDYLKSQYDARVHIKGQWVKDADGYKVATPYDPEGYAGYALGYEMDRYLPDTLNYKAQAEYISSSDPAFDAWNFERSAPGSSARSSLPDLKAVIGKDPSIKTLVIHGYYDAVTPFYQTELDLKGAGLGQRVPVKLFEGGHSTHYSEEARKPLKAALDKFYDAPPYSGSAAKEASLN